MADMVDKADDLPCRNAESMRDEMTIVSETYYASNIRPIEIRIDQFNQLNEILNGDVACSLYPAACNHAPAAKSSELMLDAPMDSVVTMEMKMDSLYEGEICEWNSKPNIHIVSVENEKFFFDANVMSQIL